MLKLRNKTRGASKVGYLVKAVRGGFTYAGAGETPIGVVTEIVPSGDFCNIQTEGKVKVYTGETITAGTELRTPVAGLGNISGQVYNIGDAEEYISVGYATGFGRGLVEVSLNIQGGSTAGTSGGGVPAGGTTGQALIKASATDYDVTWGAAGIGDAPSDGIGYARRNAGWVNSGLIIDYSGGTGTMLDTINYGETLTFNAAGSGLSVSYDQVNNIILYTFTPAGSYYDGWFIDADSGGGGSDNVVSTALVTFVGGSYIDTSLVYATPGGTPPVTADVTFDLNVASLRGHLAGYFYDFATYPSLATQSWVNTNFDNYNGFDIYTTVYRDTILSGEKLDFAASGAGLGLTYDAVNNLLTYTFTPAGSYYDGLTIDADSGTGGNVVSTALVTFVGGSNISTAVSYATPGGSPPVTADITINLDSNVSVTTVTASSYLRANGATYYANLGPETLSFSRGSTNYIRALTAGGVIVFTTNGRTGAYSESLLYLGTQYVDLKYGTGATTALKLRTSSAGVDITGDMQATGTVIADTYIRSSDASIVMGTNSAGTVYLRPNGYLSATSELTVSVAQTTVRNLLDVEADVNIDDNLEVGAGRSGKWGVYELPSMSMGSSGITDEYIVIARKYVGTLRQAHGLNGALYFQRGGTGSGNAVGRAELVVQCAYNTNDLSRFEMHGAQIYTSIDEITISGVAYYALKARTSGGGQALSHKFVGEYYNGDADGNLLTRVRASDATVTVVTTGVKYPDRMLSTGIYSRGELESYDT
jgi:hypothetical protein